MQAGDVCSRGVARQTSPEMVIAAVGMHPTGLEFILVVYYN